MSPTPSSLGGNASSYTSNRSKRSYSVSRISDLRAALEISGFEEHLDKDLIFPAHQSPIPPGRVGQQPLVKDASQYLQKDLALGSASTTLEELAHLVRLSTYQERKRQQSRLRLHRSLVSTALSARLARCGELAYRTLAENYRTDQKKDFVTLYNAIYDVRNSCDSTRRYALLEPDLDWGCGSAEGEDESFPFSTFMHELPAHTCHTVLQFLTQIRTNPDFLASRISSLGPAELTALTSFHQGSEPIESVLPFHARPKGCASSSHRNSANIPTAVERLLSFQRHDPLSALIHTCFANSAGPDSAEDLRRTDVWATTCARLIGDAKSGMDPFICSVLNVWTAMRDWSGKGSLEWFLMKILNDGAFLLEKAEDQAGTRIHVEPRNAKDSIAAEEFYDDAIKGLFEVIDASGIPEGLLELGNAILRKLGDPKTHRPAQNFLVSKYLFSTFYMNAVIHPESCGMMLGYHITEYARQKILRVVGARAQKLVVDMTWKQSHPGGTTPDVRVHIENIVSKFRSTAKRRQNTKLLPARSITSLRETAEVHPYIVLSPADLTTIVNALYPERRPTSSASLEKDMFVRSSASSLSGVSAISNMITMQPSSRSAFDNMSIISNNESILSDQTSKEPLLFEESPPAAHRFSSTSTISQGGAFEDEGYKLRLALHEMSRLLGTENLAGTCHPCAEKWAVIFLSPDGKELSIRMRHDALTEESIDDDSSDSDTDTDESNSANLGLGKEYHQLRDAIIKLLEDYEIPQSQDTTDAAKSLSNRPSTLRSPRRKQRPNVKVKLVIPSNHSKNPYRQRGRSPNTDAQATNTSRSVSLRRADSREKCEQEPYPALLAMLEAAEKQCQDQSDFINAHLYWKTLQHLHGISSPSLRQNGFASLLSIFSRGPRDSITHSAAAIEEYDAWHVWLKQSQQRHDTSIESMMLRIKSLRDKMWYATDVKNSAAYEGARNVAVALKSMVSPRLRRSLSGPRPRNIPRSMASSFLLRTESQVMEMIAAPDEWGGPNKLSDEQSEKTLRWISLGNIENFCRGEERIHRFALEIETCISKLVGDSLMEGPVLWSSELYARDKRILDAGRQKGDLFMNEMGALSVARDDGNDGNRSLRNHEFTPTARPSHRDLRSVAARNHSQQSLDSSSRWSASRSTAIGDLVDSPDYFGVSSPVLIIDSTSTFWSPFQTRPQSPTPSITSLRPVNSSTSNETVMLKGSESATQARQRFLADLKETLLGLLISDLGTLVFSKGSETDAWFSGDLGQECMERRDSKFSNISSGNKTETTLKSGKRRVIEKKKSFRDLRSANNPDQDKSSSVAAEAANDILEKGTQAAASISQPLGSSATRGRRKSIVKDASDFPYCASFKRLLNMFSVHPNPFIKLNALYELEQLIIASLTSKRRNGKYKHREVPLSPSFVGSWDASGGGKECNMEEVRRRRQMIASQTAQGSHATSNRERAANISAGKLPSADDTVEQLQNLLRNAEIRPKTLFRDLQFVASFVPASTLDNTPKGKAFWDMVLAALGLKQDVIKNMIEIADEVVEYYTKNRGMAGQAASSHHNPPLTPSHTPGTTNAESTTVLGNPAGKETIAAAAPHTYPKWSLEDAARMWTITAKEGDAVAERELAIFYLTHPELLPAKNTIPLSKPSTTFKQLVLGGGGGGGGGSGGGGGGSGGGGAEGGPGSRWSALVGDGKGDRKDENALAKGDAGIMCVAYHWMEASALGGDALARTYLKQREELEAIP